MSLRLAYRKLYIARAMKLVEPELNWKTQAKDSSIHAGSAIKGAPVATEAIYSV